LNAEIIAVGTELLLGQITDTNSAYVSRELARMGIDVYHRQTVGDNLERLTNALGHAMRRADLVVTSGGLGPTSDDITREAIAQAVGQPLELDTEYLEKLRAWFESLGYKMTENNRSQAYRPSGSEFIPNEYGSAPGLWVESNNKVIVALPGPPGELIPMWKHHVFPRLCKLGGPRRHVLFHRTLRVVELGESRAEDRIADLVRAQSNPTIAPYAKAGEVQIRITAKARTEEAAETLIKPVELALRERLGDHVYGADDDELEAVVGRMLRERALTLAVAESCTGGLVGHRITQVPGSSAYFLLGVVSYSNEAKVAQLGVLPQTLEQYGAVSSNTAREMADGIARLSGADCTVATTGIAGPTGGSPDKPVGTVWFGIRTPSGTETHRARFRGDRAFVKQRTAQHALVLLRRSLIRTEAANQHS